MSEMKFKAPCPACRAKGRDRTGDNLIVYQDDSKYCFSCGYTVKSKAYANGKFIEDDREQLMERTSDKVISAAERKELKSKTGVCEYRGVREETWKSLGIRFAFDQETGEPTHQYVPTQIDSVHTGYKVRQLPKTFVAPLGEVGKVCDMMGAFRKLPSHKVCIIVAGEMDLATVVQVVEDYAIGKKYDGSIFLPVSSTVGEGGTAKQAKINYKFFEGFDEILIGLDNDKAGQEATQQLLKALPRKCVKLIEWPMNDPNEMLQAGQDRAILNAIYSAKVHTSTSIIGSSKLMHSLETELDKPLIPLPPFMHKLSKMLDGGIPLGSIVNIGALSGQGKCLGRGTPVLLHNGDIKMVQDVVVGDMLMGDDGTPREVLSTTVGTSPLYKVKQVKGDDYVVNDSHILSLRSGTSHCGYKKGQVVNISIKDYLKSSKSFKNFFKGYKGDCTGLDNKIAVWEPYILGLWLADGTSSEPAITFNRADKELIQEFYDFCDRNSYETNITPSEARKENCFTVAASGGLMSALRGLGVLGNKHIPKEYLLSSYEDRLQLLAGFLDGDGHLSHSGYDLTIKDNQLALDIVFLARSLGLSVTTSNKFCSCPGFAGANYRRIRINGNTDKVPNRLKRKSALPRRQVKDALHTGISIEELGVGEYYGFEISGNKLFMLGDFTVTHNTSIINEIIYYLLFNSPYITGILSLELNSGQYMQTLLSRHMGKRISSISSKEERLEFIKTEAVKSAARELLLDGQGCDRFFLMEERDGNLEDIQELIEEMIINCGCKVIIIDPMTDILDGSTNDQQSLFMKWQKLIVNKYDITFININHLRKNSNQPSPDDTGLDILYGINEQDFHGSSSIFKSGSINILFARNKRNEDEIEKNTTYAMLDKSRHSGQTGLCGSWYYNPQTHTMSDREDYNEYYTK